MHGSSSFPSDMPTRSLSLGHFEPRLVRNRPGDALRCAAPEVQNGDHGGPAVGALEGEGAGCEAGDEGCAFFFCEGVVEHYCAWSVSLRSAMEGYLVVFSLGMK